MTIDSEARRSPLYVGTGSLATYAVGFEFVDEADLDVYRQLTGEEETLLVDGTDYNVSGANIVLTSNLASGALLRIVGDEDYLQDIQFATQENTYMDAFEDGLDRMTRLVQQVKEQLGLAIRYSQTFNGTPVTGDDVTQYVAWMNEDIQAIADSAIMKATYASLGGGPDFLSVLFTPTETASAPSGEDGVVYFDSDLGEYQGYANGAYGSLGGGGSSFVVSKVAHGFVDADIGKMVIKGTGAGVYTVADADSAANAEVVGHISKINTVDKFTVSKEGPLTRTTAQWDALLGTTGGPAEKAVYWLDLSTGTYQYTTTPPSLVTEVQLPAFIALSSTQVLFFGYRGTEIGNEYFGLVEFTSASLAAGVLTFNHNVQAKFVNIVIYDGDDKQVIPDEITATSSTSAAVDLSSLTVTGTWHALAVGYGNGTQSTGVGSDVPQPLGTATAGSDPLPSPQDHVHQNPLKAYTGALSGADFDITGVAGLAIVRARLIPYQESNGSWFIKGFIQQTYTANAQPNVTIDGVVFKTGITQPFNFWFNAIATNSTFIPFARATGGDGVITTNDGTGSTESTFWIEAELDSKPTWAD